ncbi:mannose-1-phosphate guanylyltransferase [Malassezia psittaci]|uniref:Mannose-1-phosphate guanylyltransferase n=1 Tax=Malassezia psittaci TaxID=1821823 RepID=A0AAF0JCS9_9BASI|nr:mannose-1-phosphate guanylyltransferase [Malassezia psittaci]
MSAQQANGTQDNAVLQQILAGISDLRREVHKVTDRLDSLEMQQAPTTPTVSMFSPSASPSMRQSYFAHQSSLDSWHPERNQGSSKSGTSAPKRIPSAPVSLKATDPNLGLWVVVPAGGAGTRLWPLSRESCPKFLLDLTGQGRTLIQNTWDRLLPLSGVEKFMVVTGNAHVEAVSEQLPQLVPGNVFAEPSPKESMAAIGLAAAVLMRRDPDAVLGSFAADHIVSGRDAFESSVREATAVAKEGFLVTIGIAPSYPSTGFGYIKLGENLQLKGAPNAYKVLEFKEKPDARTASAYLSTGEYRWNGGMFVVKAKTLMSLVEANVPELYAGINKIADAWDTPGRQIVLNETWPQLPKIAIDHAVAEPASRAGKVAVVPATFGWDDVGDFASLSDLLPAEKNEARVLGDPSLVITEGQVGGIVVPASGRQIACLGMDDVVVIDTPDALLVTTRARSQDVKKIVAKCKKAHPELG